MSKLLWSLSKSIWISKAIQSTSCDVILVLNVDESIIWDENMSYPYAAYYYQDNLVNINFETELTLKHEPTNKCDSEVIEIIFNIVEFKEKKRIK